MLEAFMMLTNHESWDEVLSTSSIKQAACPFVLTHTVRIFSDTKALEMN
jgi:hypothetical protein